MLEAEMKAQVQAYLTRLTTAVEITAFVDDGKDSADMLSLLADIASWPASERKVNVALWQLQATLPRPTDKNDQLLVFRRTGPAP